MASTLPTGLVGNGPVAWQDRTARMTTILMVGRVIAQSGDYLCRVRNLSPGGMLIECEGRISIGELIKVELRNLNVVTARVRWIGEGQMGLEFDRRVDVDDLMRQPVDTAFRPRAPRLGATCPILLWHLGRNYRATLIDVSQTGCRLELSESLAVGAEVRITIPDLPPRHAIMRWGKMGVGGFSFNEPLSFADLKAWDKGSTDDA